MCGDQDREARGALARGVPLGIALGLAGLMASSCSSADDRLIAASQAESCMTCHNGSQMNDYSGPGIENPHPFGAAASLSCTTCHGGDPDGETKEESHIPPPPEIGDRDNLEVNRQAYFNRLTLTGIDRFPDYTVDGDTFTALEYLQFINPGDLRVTQTGQSCGQCHGVHSDLVSQGLLATATGIFSGAKYAIGADNEVPANDGLYEDTAADFGFRPMVDPDFSFDPNAVGEVGELIEFPVYSRRFGAAPGDMFNNDDYDSALLPGHLNADGSVISGTPLANLFHEQVAFTCGDCHLGSAGANNRYGDFRSSGCTACHMRKSLDGRSRSGDPNIVLNEPLDPDDIDEPETSHLDRHLIRSVAQTLPSGEFVTGIDDYSCAGCHQGSNRTVMQYWGIRLDQNEDVRRGRQYPANPDSYQRTTGDTRLFDPVVGNHTFNGRDRDQYLLEEDYDGDGRDDTPPDVHYEAGLGCIDCHGSYDLHGGKVTTGEGAIASRMEHGVAIRCESCHGAADAYAPTVSGTAHDGTTADLAVDDEGNPLPHVVRNSSGEYWLTSKLTGQTHYVVQTLDTVVDNGRIDPRDSQPIYSDLASYAMGRDDDLAATGIGPQQTGNPHLGFSHMDSMSCASCHASWTNNCIGCHLEGEYNGGNNFSNITGERIVFREREADFVYQSPVFFQLGVGSNNKIEPIAPNTETFFRYRDRQGDRSDTFAFSDRNGKGNNRLETNFPSLAHNVMMPHSIRGKVNTDYEGPRYCVACHLTDSVNDPVKGPQYQALRTAMQTGDYSTLDNTVFNILRDDIGLNTGNQNNSPLWVHMVAGLGTGLFLFDEDGCPTNPLDNDANRKGCNGNAPASFFDINNARFNLDRIVDESGVEQGSNNHPMRLPVVGPNLRDGASNPNLSGPLGMSLVQRLTDPVSGIVLNSWIDADGNPQGDAGDFVGP